MLPFETDVLIVGAGPTGLALAASLQQAGVAHVIIDALAEAQNTSRAGVIHPHTLEMLEELGVSEQIQAEALALDRFTIRDRDSALLTIGFDQLPTQYRWVSMIPQPRTEAILTDRLEETGGRTHREVQLLSIRQQRDAATCRLATSEGEQEVRARFVVGADGMNSTVRASTSIRFDGEAYGQSFVLADVRMDWPLGQSEVSLCFSPSGLVVVAPLPDGSFRVVATVDDAPQHRGIDDLQYLLDTRGPRTARARIDRIVWSSRFRVHHRLASSHREGRVLLMGDAAHVHSPAGGQGMNVGLVDAAVLGQALTAVLRDGAPLAVLDRYAELRRSAATEVLSLASRLTRLAIVRPVGLRWLRNLVLRILDRSPGFKRRLAFQLSGISRRHLSELQPTPATLEAYAVKPRMVPAQS